MYYGTVKKALSTIMEDRKGEQSMYGMTSVFKNNSRLD